METYTKDQVFENIRWGTMMPIPVMVAGEILEVRARGNVSVIVAEPPQMPAQMENPEDLETELRGYFSACINDAIGELSKSALNIEQFLTITAPTTELFQSRFDQRLAGMGLKVRSLVIEAIEKI